MQSADLEVFTGSYIMNGIIVGIVRRPFFEHDFAWREAVLLHPRLELAVIFLLFVGNFGRRFHKCVGIGRSAHIPTFSDIAFVERKWNCEARMRNEVRRAKWS